MTVAANEMTRSDVSFKRAMARRGPMLLIAAAVTALAVTALAMWLDPALATPKTPDYIASGVVMTLVDLAAGLGFTGLAFAGAVRPGRFSTLAFAIAIAASFAMVPAELLLRVDFAVGNALYGVVGPLQAIGLVLVGIAIVTAHRWHSWGRFTVLALGLYVPLVMVPVLVASGGTSLAALAGYHALILAVGIGFRIESVRTRP